MTRVGELIDRALLEYSSEYDDGGALDKWRELLQELKPRLTSHQILVLEAHHRIMRSTSAEATVVTLDELQELLRVARLLSNLTSERPAE